MSKAALTRTYRLHVMERATVVFVDNGVNGQEFCNCLNSFGDQDANAAFIARACNSHYELLEALKELLDATDMGLTGSADRNAVFDAARAAISKAEATT